MPVPLSGLENKFLTCERITSWWSRPLHVFILLKREYLTQRRSLTGVKVKKVCQCFLLRSQWVF